MTEIPDRPFDKIAIDLVTDCKMSTSGNKHILTIIDHLTGWPEAFPIPDKSADTIVTTLINHYLLVHMCPRYILSDKGTEFKNNLMDQVLQQLGIDRIFSAPYHLQSNGKLEVFHKYLKPILKKFCKKDPANWDKYIICTTTQDINNLYNLTTTLAASINFNQMILHIRSVFANLQDFLHYLCTLSTHTMDYIDATTSGILSPNVLPVADLQRMFQHIANTLPPTLHLPISPVHTLHFYRYLHTHILIENKQFLLLVDIPIQDRAHHITIHEVFTLDISHGNYSANYDINTRYFGVTKDATMGLELPSTQFEICQQANGQFCHISTPFQPLANPSTCIAALYTKSAASIISKCSLWLHKATTTSLPTQITPNVWILMTPAATPKDTISLICPEKPMETIPI